MGQVDQLAAENADILDDEASGLVEDLVRVSHEGEFLSGASLIEDAFEPPWMGSCPSALLVGDLRQSRVGGFGEVGLREPDVLARSTEQIHGAIGSRRRFRHDHRL